MTTCTANDAQPARRTVRRNRLAAGVGVGLCAALLAGCMTPPESSGFDQINMGRNWVGLRSLDQNEPLIDKAQAWAQHLADVSGGQCVLSHSNLSTGAPAGWRKLGENVGCATVRGDQAAAVKILADAFMNSPPHRANILDPAFNVGGVGMASRDIGGGLTLVFEAQEFAQL